MRRKTILSAVLIAGLMGISGITTTFAWMANDSLSAGVLWQQQAGSISPNASYSGAALQYWPMLDQVIQFGFALETEGNRNASVHAEFQHHFLRRPTDLHALFLGGGLFYEDSPGDDWVAVYAPLGFRLQLREYPVSFTVNTSIRLFIDPETIFEAFDEVRLGVFYTF